MAEILEQDRSTKIVIVSGQGEKGPALEAIGSGAYDFVGKPVDMAELRLLLLLGQLFRRLLRCFTFFLPLLFLRLRVSLRLGLRVSLG